MDLNQIKEEFKEIFGHIKRAGADELFAALERSDFFTAPASSRFHLAEPGGLCRHSINVYNRLCSLLNYEYSGHDDYSGDSVAIVALLHDLCKAEMYRQCWKNQKTYDPKKVAAADRWQVKHDAAGDFIWETVPSYEIDERFVFGHGEKSVYLIMKYMELTDEEAQAIRYHMGLVQEGDTRDAAKVYSQNPLAFFLHVADEAATFLDEAEETK